MSTILIELKIDDEFKKLIPASTDEEYALLHESIDKDGCLDPIKVWNGYIIDGHTRYHICHLLKKPFNTLSMEFQSREEAKKWILQHQLGKRNLNDAQKIELALKMKPLIAQLAKTNQKAAGGTVPIKISKPVDTREEIAKMADVSPAQVSKMEYILSEGSEDDIARLRSGNSSIHAIHGELQKKKAKIDRKSTSITKKQMDGLLKEILAKVEKISMTSQEIVVGCGVQLRDIISRLTDLADRIEEDACASNIEIVSRD
jgi:predicted transcriptional regulator